MLTSHLEWETSHQYLELFEKFLKKNLSSSKFCERGSLNTDVANLLQYNLILLSPHEKSLGFSELLQEIFLECQRFKSQYLNGDDSRDELRNSVEKSFVKIKKYLTEEPD
jgi:hypothetical protein